jgi:hypothetical protein
VYTYDDDNRLKPAQANGGMTWKYSFNGNSSLVESLPGAQAGEGAKRYTHNTAGQLVQAEEHTGSAYQVQAEMVYNGKGQRTAMSAYQDGQSLTTRYMLDSQILLAASAEGATTYYLPGVGEYKEAWSNKISELLSLPQRYPLRKTRDNRKMEPVFDQRDTRIRTQWRAM